MLPRLAATLSLAPSPGLHEYLRWGATAPQILQSLVLAGPESGSAAHPLVCVVAGERALAPAALIDLASLRHAVAKLRDGYERVVLLGPSFDGERGSLEAIAAAADVLLAAVAPEALASGRGRALGRYLRKLPTETLGAVVVNATDTAQRS